MKERKMKNFRYHLKYSIIACLLIFFLFPLLVQNLVNRKLFGNMLESKIASLYDQTAESISYSLSNALQSEYDIARTMANSSEIVGLAGKEGEVNLENRRTKLKYLVIQKLEVTKYAYPFGYIVANREGEMFCSTFAIANGKEEKRGKAFYGDERLESIWNAYASTAKFFVGEDYLMSKAGKQLYCVTNLIDSDKRVGVVAINMDQSYFAKLLSRSLFSQGSSAYIVDRKGNCLIQGEESSLDFQDLTQELRDLLSTDRAAKENYQQFRIGGEHYVLFLHSIKVKGLNESWTMANLVPLEDLNSEITRINGVNSILIVLCIVSILVLIRFFYWKIFKPLQTLNQMTIELGRGNLGVHVEEKSVDEIGNLIHAFNEMSKDLQTSMEKIKEQEKSRHQMEIRMLQSQIKPHFVRNTLNAIRWMAKLKGAEGISRSILAFSNMLDYNFSDNRNFVEVSDELKYLEDYLYLQQVRFQNNFSYTMEVEEPILDCRILKLSFQPVVENAINHGVLPKNKMGRITIKGNQRGDKLVFEIVDDGVGMEKTQVETLLEEREDWEKAQQEENIALWNISKRMHMNYGDEGWIEIESEPGQGTCVRMVFPVYKGKEGEEDAETVDRG